MIDGVQQTQIEVTDTSAKFELSGMLDETSSDVQIYFSDGLPGAYADFKSVSVVPTLVSVSPATGSSGGTLLTVTGTGFGVNTVDVNLVHETSGVDICVEVTVTGYGSFTCLTAAMEIASTDVLLLKTASGTYSCGNTLSGADCFYEQLDASSPSVAGATIDSANTMTITGDSFPTSGFNAIIVFKGVQSSSAVINDATSITVTFDNGVPVSEEAASPSVRFVPADGRRRLVSLEDADLQLIATQVDVTVSNTLAVTDSTSGLSCSF